MQYYILCRNKTRGNKREKRCLFALFYFIRLSLIRLNSRAGKRNRILSWLARDFPRLSRWKKNSFDHEITLPLSSGSIKTQTFSSKKALERKKRELGFAYFSTGKIRTSSAGSHITAWIFQGVYSIVEFCCSFDRCGQKKETLPARWWGNGIRLTVSWP